MRAKVIGIQHDVKMEFDGKRYEGLNLFLGEEKFNVNGLKPLPSVFVNKEKSYYPAVYPLVPGDQVNVYYNQYRKVDEVVPVIS